jgi:hypothetical protein
MRSFQSNLVIDKARQIDFLSNVKNDIINFFILSASTELNTHSKV